MSQSTRPNREIAGILLWDIDGTLVHVTPSRQDKHLAAAQAVLGTQIQAPPSWTGRTDAEILQGLIAASGSDHPVTDLAEMLAELDRLTELELIELPTHPTIGSEQALVTTADLGWINGVVTGNTAGRARSKLESASLSGHIDWRYCFTGDAAENRDVLMQEAAQRLGQIGPELPVIVIGDTPRDVTSSQAARIPVVAVATGLYGIAELSALEPSLCIENLELGLDSLLALLRHR